MSVMQCACALSTEIPLNELTPRRAVARAHLLTATLNASIHSAAAPGPSITAGSILTHSKWRARKREPTHTHTHIVFTSQTPALVSAHILIMRVREEGKPCHKRHRRTRQKKTLYPAIAAGQSHVECMGWQCRDVKENMKNIQSLWHVHYLMTSSQTQMICPTGHC